MSLSNTQIASRRFSRFRKPRIMSKREREQLVAKRLSESRGATTIPWIPTLEEIADVGSLLNVFHQRKQWAGAAPGIDGMSWDDMGRSEAADVFRPVSRAMLNGTYVPSPDRRTYIPREGRSPRPLDIGTVVNRTVASVLATKMSPILETILGPYSFAYRPGRSSLSLLASAATIAREEDLWVIGNHDIKQAFPSISLDGVMEAHRQYIRDPKLLGLIERIIRGAANKQTGLSQGCPYSPSAMELYAYTILDSKMSQDPTNPPRLRYSDNLVPLSRSVSEGQLVKDRYRLLLSQVGLSIKESTDPNEKSITDLKAGETTQLLGFIIGYQEGKMTFGIGKGSWDTLKKHLDECHHLSNPSTRAASVLEGWLAAMGPTFDVRSESIVISKIVSMMNEASFRETNPETVRSKWEDAWRIWEQLLRRTSILYRPMKRAEG
ncbi:MAG: hypothetical protein K8T89_05520 [Planctomycetes bacterium]|nr:hypothetical protein [Planctomycetota bacterium]